MTSRWFDRVARWHDKLEEAMGMVLPALALASLVPDLVSLQSVALAALWMGWGHTLLYYLGLYPKLRCRPVFKGLVAFAAGLAWPLWFLPQPAIRR